jgi:flagellar assembly protein FliH
MSRLLREERARAAAALGSFVLSRDDPRFTPWASDGEAAADNDLGPRPPVGEEALLRARAEGFAEGFEEGRRASELELAADRAALARLAETLEALRPDPAGALALLLAETVDRLVRQVVGEVEVDAVALLARARAAAALVGAEMEPARLRVHPDDAAHLAEARLAIEIAPDPAIERGAVRVETAAGWIEDSPAIRLERLRAELDRMGAAR